MKQLRQIAFITFVTTMLPAIAYANAGPAIAWRFGIHLVVLTFLIGIGEAILLCIVFRTWKSRVFYLMVGANVASAWIGMLFVKSRCAALIMGDVTIENLRPTFWTMVYVTFVLTIIIEFPFFVAALYGRKRLIPKAVAATLLAHCVSYTLLFYYYTPDYVMNMATELEVVPASAFEIAEDYDLYYISPDGKHVLKSDLTGNNTEEVATLDLKGIPDRLCACPRKLIEETKTGKNNERPKTIQRVSWESGFDLYVLMKVDESKREYKATLLLKNFSPYSAVVQRDNEYHDVWDTETDFDCKSFRTFGKAEKWLFYSDYWGFLQVSQVKPEDLSETTAEQQSGLAQGENESTDSTYMVDAPFMQWWVRNGTQIAGGYGVFKLGKDQICILDPEKKRIALITRGFGPVVAKPPLKDVPEESPEETNKQTVIESPQ